MLKEPQTTLESLIKQTARDVFDAFDSLPPVVILIRLYYIIRSKILYGRLIILFAFGLCPYCFSKLVRNACNGGSGIPCEKFECPRKKCGYGKFVYQYGEEK